MKFTKNGALFRRRRVVRHLGEHPGQGHDLAEEDPATRPSVEFKSAHSPMIEERPRKSQRLVRFAATATVHEPTSDMLKKEELAEHCWYSGEDLLAFRKEMRRDVVALRQLEQDMMHLPDTWAKTWMAVYDSYCREEQVEHDNISNHEESATTCQVDIFTLGMEKRAIGAICLDTAHRRKQLASAILHCQALMKQTVGPSPAIRTATLRELSRRLSRPSRLYAQHVGAVAVAANW